jgi:formylglycine-generating enzyme required for sulfatase activity
MVNYADLEIRILKQEAAGYPVELELTLEGSQRQQFQGGYLHRDILSWQPSLSPAKDGEQLFERLFAGDQLKQAWAQIRGQSERRRVRLRMDDTAPELHVIPWECLRDTSPGYSPKSLAASADTPFSRYIAGQWPAGEPIVDRPLKVLVAIANPDNLAEYDLTPIEIETERGLIADAFSDLIQGQVELTFLEQPVTLARLEAELKRGYHVLHIVAHGLFKSQAFLFLADDHNQVERASEDDFAAMIDRLGQQPRLIFLASCQTATRSPADAFRGLAPRLVAAGVPAVLAMQAPVPVETARRFARAFYRQLFQHGQVDLASNEARSILLSGDVPGSSIPVLFSRLPDNQLLAQLTGDRAPVIETQPFEPQTVYIPAGPFLMGSQPGEGVPEYETPQHEVDLPAYRIGKCPVTNAQYAEFIRQTRRLVPPEMGWIGQRPPEGMEHHPVRGVTWYNALAYTQWLSERTGRKYSLPSEAQWEKAARCSDLSGDVREWTCTLWGEKRLAPDPKYAYPWAEDGRNDLSANRLIRRVLRGGASQDEPSRLRCSARSGYAPDDPGPPGKRHSFRVVMAV